MSYRVRIAGRFKKRSAEQDSINLIEHAMAAGVNFSDTADAYIQGKALRKARESVVLATKVAHKSGAAVTDSGLSRRHLVRGIQDSLRC